MKRFHSIYFKKNIFSLGYGSPNLITPYGKIFCIIYTLFGFIFALLFQQILHRKLIPKLYEIIYQFAINRYIIYYSTKSRSYLTSFLLIIFIIIFFFIIIPTLFIHSMYVPQWSLIDLTYFTVITNHLIGFGDFMPCHDLNGESRSNCSIVLTSKSIIFS